MKTESNSFSELSKEGEKMCKHIDKRLKKTKQHLSEENVVYPCPLDTEIFERFFPEAAQQYFSARFEKIIKQYCSENDYEILMSLFQKKIVAMMRSVNKKSGQTTLFALLFFLFL